METTNYPRIPNTFCISYAARHAAGSMYDSYHSCFCGARVHTAFQIVFRQQRSAQRYLCALLEPRVLCSDDLTPSRKMHAFVSLPYHLCVFVCFFFTEI